MAEILYQKKTKIWRKCISAFVAFTFFLSLVSGANAQYITNLPKPGEMVLLSPAFEPAVLKGMTIHPENPLQFDFIVDRGQDKLSGEALKAETQRLLKYFLAAMTIPDDDSWVNLSPYENDRIIPDMLGTTDMGKAMLEQDYLLKQLSASLTNPQEEIGKKFWNTVYKKAFEKFGTTTIPINTFNKVWITPDRAVILEQEGYVFVGESHLKVMLDEDYTSVKENLKNKKLGTDQIAQNKVEELSSVSSDVVREIIIPELEKEINQGKNFVQVRQIYNSVILATWYKQNLKNSLLGKVYVDKSKISGVDIPEKDIKQKVYEQYLAAFRKGVYNLIKEDYDLASKETLPRKYFSGGVQFKIGQLTPASPEVATAVKGRIKAAAEEGRYASSSVRMAEGQKEAQVVTNLVAKAGSSPIVTAPGIELLAAAFSETIMPTNEVGGTEVPENLIKLIEFVELSQELWRLIGSPDLNKWEDFVAAVNGVLTKPEYSAVIDFRRKELASGASLTTMTPAQIKLYRAAVVRQNFSADFEFFKRTSNDNVDQLKATLSGLLRYTEQVMIPVRFETLNKARRAEDASSAISLNPKDRFLRNLLGITSVATTNLDFNLAMRKLALDQKAFDKLIVEDGGNYKLDVARMKELIGIQSGTSPNMVRAMLKLDLRPLIAATGLVLINGSPDNSDGINELQAAASLGYMSLRDFGLEPSANNRSLQVLAANFIRMAQGPYVFSIREGKTDLEHLDNQVKIIAAIRAALNVAENSIDIGKLQAGFAAFNGGNSKKDLWIAPLLIGTGLKFTNWKVGDFRADFQELADVKYSAGSVESLSSAEVNQIQGQLRKLAGDKTIGALSASYGKSYEEMLAIVDTVAERIARKSGVDVSVVKEKIMQELNGDIYSEFASQLTAIKSLVDAGRIAPQALPLVLSAKDKPQVLDSRAFKNADGTPRAPRALYWPLKGDPWQVGHLWILLESIQKFGIDKVVVGIDNSDPTRKPDLSSLAIREAVTVAILDKYLKGLVEYTPLAKEDPAFFSADGETMVIKVIQLNQGFVDQDSKPVPIEWFYGAGSDHANLFVLKKVSVAKDLENFPGALARLQEKGYLDQNAKPIKGKFKIYGVDGNNGDIEQLRNDLQGVASGEAVKNIYQAMFAPDVPQKIIRNMQQSGSQAKVDNIIFSQRVGEEVDPALLAQYEAKVGIRFATITQKPDTASQKVRDGEAHIIPLEMFDIAVGFKFSRWGIFGDNTKAAQEVAARNLFDSNVKGLVANPGPLSDASRQAITKGLSSLLGDGINVFDNALVTQLIPLVEKLNRKETLTAEEAAQYSLLNEIRVLAFARAQEIVDQARGNPLTQNARSALISSASSAVIVNSDGRSMMDMIGETISGITSPADLQKIVGNLAWLMTTDPLEKAGAFEAEYAAMSVEQLDQQLPLFIGAKRPFSQAPFVDNLEALSQNGVQGFLDVYSSKYAGGGYVGNIKEFANDFIVNSLMNAREDTLQAQGLPPEMISRILSSQEQGGELNLRAKAWVREVLLRSGVPDGGSSFAASSAVGQATVLVVGDAFTAALLSRSGYAVIRAKDNGEANTILSQKKVDVIVSGDGATSEDLFNGPARAVPSKYLFATKNNLDARKLNVLQGLGVFYQEKTADGIRELVGKIGPALQQKFDGNVPVVLRLADLKAGQTGNISISFPSREKKMVVEVKMDNVGGQNRLSISPYEEGDFELGRLEDVTNRDFWVSPDGTIKKADNQSGEFRGVNFDIAADGKSLVFRSGSGAGTIDYSAFAANADKKVASSASAGVTTGEPPVGGIDFDPSLLNLQIKRNGKGVPLPLPQQNIEKINIDGLYPVIINIQPATIQNFPFLSSAEKDNKVPELSMR